MNKRIVYCSLVLLYLFISTARGQIEHQVAFSSQMQLVEKVADDGSDLIVPNPLLYNFETLQVVGNMNATITHPGLNRTYNISGSLWNVAF